MTNTQALLVTGLLLGAFVALSSPTADVAPPAVSIAPAPVVQHWTAPTHDADAEPTAVEPSQIAAPEPTVRNVVWLTDYKKARQLATDDGKRLLVRFTAPWCAPCQVHASKDSSPERRSILNRFVCLKVNVDEHPEWKVKAVPLEAVYEPASMQAVTGINPMASDYPLKLKMANEMSVVRKPLRRAAALLRGGTVAQQPRAGNARCENPLCRCSPCPGPGCQCGQQPAYYQPRRTYGRCRGGRCG